MSISAMKQALEALDWNYDNAIDNLPAHEQWAAMLRQIRITLRQAIAEAENIVPSDYSNSHQQEPVAWIVDGKIKVRLDMAGKLYYSETPLYIAPVHAIEQAEKQEAVAWVVFDHKNNDIVWIGQKPVDETAKDRRQQERHVSYVCPNCHWSLNRQEPETAKDRHEPVAWLIQYEYRHEFLRREPTSYEKNSALEVKPLYAASPKREWVELTDDEIAKYWGDAFAGNTQYVQRFARIIEAKLKEKNCG